MAKRLVTRAEFARDMGLARSTVTEMTKPGGRLHDALYKDTNKIDLDSPAVLAYQKYRHDHDPSSQPAEGIHPKYDEVLAWCRQTQCWAPREIPKHIDGVSRSQAYKLIAMFKAANVDMSMPEIRYVPPSVPPKVETKPQQPAMDDLEGTIPENMRAVADMTLRNIIYKYGTLSQFGDMLAALLKIENIEEKRLKNEERAGELVSRELVKKGVLQPISGVFAQLLQAGAKSLALRAHTMANAGDDVMAIESEMQKLLTQYIKPAKKRLSKALND